MSTRLGSLSRGDVDHAWAHAYVQREIVSDLPDRADQTGKCFLGVEFALVAQFRHRAGGPIMGALNDNADRQIGALLVDRNRPIGAEFPSSRVAPRERDSVCTVSHVDQWIVGLLDSISELAWQEQ